MSRDQTFPLSKYKLCDDSLFYPGCCPYHDRISLASKTSISSNCESLSNNNNNNNNNIFDKTPIKRQENQYSNSNSFTTNSCFLIFDVSHLTFYFILFNVKATFAYNPF